MRYLLLVVFSLVIEFSLACTCINVKQLSEKEFSAYNLVVKGTIVSVDSSGNQKKILIKVLEIYKGAKGQSEVLVVSAKASDSCGIKPAINETWLIYSLEMGEFNYYTDVCTKSKSLDIKRTGAEDKALRNELKFLGRKTLR